MTKPKLPKKWKGLKWGTVTKGRYPRISAFRRCGYDTVEHCYSSVALRLRQEMFPCAIVNDWTNRIPLSRLVRAVELAAIHAGLVEDRDG